jgi:excisionase family DNA binding protein
MRYLNLTEVAEYLRKSKSSIYKWCSDGQIPYIKSGKKLLFNKDEIDKWLEAHSIPTKEEFGNTISKLLKQNRNAKSI